MVLPGGLTKIKERDSFRKVISSGSFKVKETLVLYYRQNSEEFSRYGFMVPKRAGKAHDRNRIRRWLSEALRGISHQIPTGFDIVIMVRDKMDDATFWTVKRDLQFLLKQSRLLKI